LRGRFFSGEPVPVPTSPENALMIVTGSNLAKQEQDQENNNYKAKAAAPVVASPVETAAANSTKTAQQCDHQDDE